MTIVITCVISSILTLVIYSIVIAANRIPDRISKLGEEINQLKAENFRLRERILILGGEVDE